MGMRRCHARMQCLSNVCKCCYWGVAYQNLPYACVRHGLLTKFIYRKNVNPRARGTSLMSLRTLQNDRVVVVEPLGSNERLGQRIRYIQEPLGVFQMRQKMLVLGPKLFKILCKRQKKSILLIIGVMMATTFRNIS